MCWSNDGGVCVGAVMEGMCVGAVMEVCVLEQ